MSDSHLCYCNLSILLGVLDKPRTHFSFRVFFSELRAFNTRSPEENKKKGIWGLNTTTTDYDDFHKFSTRRWFIFLTISNDIDFPSHVLRNGDLFFPPKTRQANLLHTIKLLAQFFCNVNQDPFKEMDQKWYLLLEILATNGIL